jgi:hypothetical protein
MNFITTNHRGGLGNVLFKLAACISLAMENNINYSFSREFIRPSKDPDYNTYADNILRNIKFSDKLNFNYSTYRERAFNYNKVPYTRGTNLLLDGYFQSEKYFIANKGKIIDIFKPTENIKNTILKSFPDISKFCSIHVRRGDYLSSPNCHPQQPIDYFIEAVNIIGKDKTYLIFSDDLEGIKDMFDFIPNKIFYTSGKDWLDLYTMSMCGHNIICNSTFSWWAAYLNENRNKKVITTSYWFGPKYADHDTSSLFPSDWIVIKNKR